MHLFHQLQKAHSTLFRMADRYLRSETGITAAQQGVLFALTKHDGLTMSALAELLALSNSNVTGLIDRMTKQGLVRRQESSNDGRAQCVFIETAGLEISKQVLPLVKDINEALLAPFDTQERAIIERFLEHIHNTAGQLTASDQLFTSSKRKVS